MTQQPSSAVVVRQFPGETSYTPVVSSSGMSYRPFLELGEGGMAKVFLARAVGPSGFNKLVVLKSMRLDDCSDEGIRQMFVDEARLSARFNHPNLVQVQEVNLTADPPYLVMEYLDGKPLSALRGVERVTLGMRLSIISELLIGLHHAHELCHFDGSPLGIVHRDVSPHNAFVTYDGAVKVLDFGIAKMVTNNTRTEAGEVKGKLAYMAPEQMMGTEVDRRADIFSVGSILWEAAVGRRMWEGITEATLMHRLATGEIPRPSEHGSLDPELEEIIVRATAPDREDRFATAQQLQVELDRYMARSGEHCSLRQIGAVLAEVFQTERQRNLELINKALRASLPPPRMVAPEQELTQASAPASEVRGSRWPWLVAGALVLLAGAAFVVPRQWQSKPAPESLGPALVTLKVRARPATARITIDGKDYGSELATLRAPLDARDHIVRVTAPGHVAETRVVKLDRNQDLDVLLEPELASEVAPAVVPHAQPSSPVRAGARSPSRSAPPKVAPKGGVVSAAPTPPAAPSCSPPYYFSNGIKTYKPECL